MRAKYLWIYIGLGFVALLLCDFRSTAQIPVVLTPQTLNALEYTQQNGGGGDEFVSYGELVSLINSCHAYAKGISVLPEFHEPVLTRGDTGIAVFRKVSPSVVMVVMANFKNDKISETALGTGAILDSSGYVLTNWHVVEGFQAGVIFLKPANGTEPPENSAYGMRLIATNKQADLALVKIVKPPVGLVGVTLGDIARVQVAQDIHIIGHPHGKLWSYSTGVVSQIRDSYEWKYEDGSQHSAKVLQMQTAINPGNSGGPVLDNNGNMLGLVAMSEEGQNLDYAIAIDVIKDFVTDSMAVGRRGSEAKLESPTSTRFIGHTKDGLAVTKTTYPDFIVYTVRDAKGSPVEVVAELPDGSTLTGTKPNAFGGLGSWSYTQGGKTFTVKSEGTAPELITAAAGS